MLKYWPQRLLHKSLLRSFYEVNGVCCVFVEIAIFRRVSESRHAKFLFDISLQCILFFYLFQFLLFNQNKMWKLLEFEKTWARREKSKLTLKTLKHKISVANSYRYLVFAIICYFTITRKLTICLFLSRRALVFD